MFSPIALTCLFSLLAILLGSSFWWQGRLNKNKQTSIALETEKDLLDEQLKENQQKQAVLQESYQQAQIKLSALQAQSQQERQHYEEKLALLSEAKSVLGKEFENLAHRIFDDKQEKFQKQFQQQSQVHLDSAINPLREQLGNFHKKVEDVYDKESKQRSSLIGEIRLLKELNQQISQDAVNLTQALKGDNKAQGNFGEVILERILEQSGLTKGREYETQVSFTDDEGKRKQPDVIVRLPEGKDIIIDAKMTLVDWERYCSADNETDRATALKSHINAIKNHIKGLSRKDYENIEGIRTLDFVLLFIPIESAFMVALEHDPDIFSAAFEKGISIVSPTNLLVTLKIVQNIWRYEKQNKNAEKIAMEAGNLHNQFALVLESFQDIEKHLGQAQRAYEKTKGRIVDGKGNLVGRIDKLEKLGAKTKKSIPVEFQSAGLIGSEQEVESE